MKIVLFLLLLSPQGEAQLNAFPYPSMAECEARIKELPKIVLQHNMTEEAKIANYSAVCAEIKKAPKGVEI